MMKLRRRVFAGCLAACITLSAGAAGIFAQGSQGGTPGAETDGTYNGRPNYVYKAMGSIASDLLFGQQWGLYNDGTFKMEEKENPYPVFDDPFEEPWDPGQWEIDFSKVIYEQGKEASTAKRTAAKSITAQAGIDINIKDAWNKFNTNGSEVVVAVIDTGIDYTNPQLADSMWVNEGEIAGDGIDNDGNGYVDDVYGWNFYDNNNKVYTGTEDNHGTHGAGTIAAKRDSEGTAGIAGSSNVKVMALKALGGKDGSGTTESIIAAIKYAEANGASICNLSLGTEGNDRSLYEAIKNSSMLFVAAAGNGSDWTGTGLNTDRTPTYPAAWNLDNLISVANLQSDGTLHSSSNYGANTIDIAAPGSYILSTVAGGEYSYMTGTSMAAPMVSGVAAMLYSQYGDLTAWEAKGILTGSAKKLSSLTGKVKSGGMLDAGAALSYDRASVKQPTEQPTSGNTGDTGNNGSTGQNPAQPPSSTNPPLTVVYPVPGTPDSGQNTGKGSAPVITISTSSFGMKGYLMVNVADPDGDLKLVRYAEGRRGAAWFSGGKNGVPFSLSDDGTGSFSYTESGVYTFYALDGKGNETVKTVTLSGSSRSFFDFSDLFRFVMPW